MTTPNQGAPDGAVTVGGGEWLYGQYVNEKQTREMFEFEAPSNLGEALDMLPSALALIPNSSTRGWQKWLGKSDEERENGTVKQALIDSLDKRPIRKLLNNLWNGLTGNEDEDDKTPEDVLAAAEAVRLSVEGANEGLVDVASSGSNLVKNADFERGLSSQPLQGVFSDDVAFAGTKSLKMTSNGAGRSYSLMSEGLTPKTMPASENDVYYLEVMVRGASTNVQASGGAEGIRLVISPFSRTGTALTEQYRFLNSTTVLNNTWTRLAGFVGPMPAGTTRAGISLVLTPAVANGSTFYFDCVVVREVTLASQASAQAAGAQTAATNAQGAASTAQLTANNANSAASTAQTAATTANTTANTANSTANTANTTANTANSTATSANSTANTANTNATTANNNVTSAVTGISESVNGGSTGNATVRTALRNAWANLWDGMNGTTGTTDKLPGDVRAVAGIVRSRAITADTNATQGLSNGQMIVDNVHQGIFGGSASNNNIGSVRTNLQQAWASIWDGLNGTTGSTSKTPGDVRPIAAALKSLAGTANTNATGAQSTANTVTSNHSALVDNIVVAQFGEGSATGGSLAEALEAMKKTQADIADNTKAIQTLQQRRDVTVSKGTTFSVDFSNFGTVSAAGFALSYTGPGTSTIVVSNGVAQWNVVGTASRDAKLVYAQQTATDFQAIRGTMASPPQPGGPAFYAIARVSPDGLNYVWARAYAQSLGVYKADIGYTVNGAEMTWVTGIPLKWSLDMKFVAGNGTSVREYQVWSGDTVVWSHIESGTSSRLCGSGHTTPSAHTDSCVKYRYWGAIAQVRNGKVAGRVSSCSATDNGTPAVTGSTARMVRTSTANVTFEGGNVAKALPASFFDSAVYESLDVDAVPALNCFRVSTGKPYVVTARIALSANVAALSHLLLQTSNDGSSWTTIQYGNSVYPNNGEALSGSWIQYLNAGQYVRVAYIRGGINVNALTGESSGSQTFFSIASAEGAGS